MLTKNTHRISLVKTLLILFLLGFVYANLYAQIPNESALVKLTNGRVDSNAAITVYVFFSPQCPICINMIIPLNEIAGTYKDKGVAFKIIYSGSYYSDEKIKSFQKEYGLQIEAYKDKEFLFAKQLSATITPTAFVFNKQQKVYDGKINNRYENIGKRRTIITEEYLKDAIDSALKGNLPPVQHTESVGCFLEYK